MPKYTVVSGSKFPPGSYTVVTKRGQRQRAARGGGVIPRTFRKTDAQYTDSMGEQNGRKTVGLDGDTLGRKRTGDESYLASLMRAIGRVDGENDYVVYVRDAEAVRPSFPDMPRFRFRPVTPSSIWLRFPFSFPIALRRDPVDLLHVQYFVPPASRSPVVLTVHDISFAVHPEFFIRKDRLLLNALVPWSLRRADRIITDAEFTKREMVRVHGLDPERIEVIPLAADPRYRPLDKEHCRKVIAERHDTADGFMLYVGTLQPRKNVATLIHAYTMFRKRTGLPHKLVIVGKPKYKFKSVLDAIHESGFESDIVFTGFVDDDDLPVYYNAADVFVFPSLYEGFGLPPLEAMACGTPVIAANSSCIPEVVGDAAILADPGDPGDFCDAMTRVLGDPRKVTEMQTKGTARAKQFSWDRTARETIKVYRDVLKRSNGR